MRRQAAWRRDAAARADSSGDGQEAEHHEHRGGDAGSRAERAERRAGRERPRPASTGTVPAQKTAMTSAPPSGEPVPAAVATNTYSQPQGSSVVRRPDRERAHDGRRVVQQRAARAPAGAGTRRAPTEPGRRTPSDGRERRAAPDDHQRAGGDGGAALDAGQAPGHVDACAEPSRRARPSST